MAKIVFCRSENKISFVRDDGFDLSFECRAEFFPVSHGQSHEALPDGDYIAVADNPPAENNSAYGTFYISTGDARGRDIHGGGSDLDDPFAPRQGWEPTYGCLRMQNEDGQALSYLIISAGNNIPLTVMS